jgi:perosamine synthetase
VRGDDPVIPLFRPSCTDLEVRYVTEVLRSGWWGLGPKTAEFEERFARYVGTQHAVAVNSGTAALQLALEGLGATAGDVIIPALTFASTALAALHAGNRVVFADVDDDDLCLDWDDAGQKVTPHTKAVVPVWYGGTVSPPPHHIRVPVVEDCAHAAGSQSAGRHGAAGCWSFHAVKNLACGDGGMITTDDAKLAGRLRELRWCGINRSTWDRDRARYGWEYDITRPGHKAHMNDLTAALGLAQLERLDDLNKVRRDLVARYLEAFKGLPWLRLPAWNEASSWHLFYVRVDADARDMLIDHLLAAGVSAGVHYKPLNAYPVFGPHQSLPVTDRVWKQLVTLPLFPDMTGPEFDQVVTAVKSFVW